jgi:hypothetical protein
MEVGKRLFSEVVNWKAQNDLRGTFLEFPESSDLLSWRKVDFALLKTAVDRLSWWLYDLFDSKPESKSLCYVAVSDIRYWLIAIAASKTSSKVSSKQFISLNPW